MTGVEDVMDFCSEEDRKKFLKGCPMFDQVLVNNGIILLKYWLDVSEKEQHPRFLARIEDPTKRWKLSPIDLESHRRWYDYSRARDAMLSATDVPFAPWHLVLLVAHKPPKLPPRRKSKGLRRTQAQASRRCPALVVSL